MEILPITVGIPDSSMDYFSARQLDDQWCWAASVKMVLNYYGVAITQKQIVARTYGTDEFGRLPNWPATYKTIHRNLNYKSIDLNGNKYSVIAKIGKGRPNHIWLINEINSQRPIIISYRTGVKTGHAVVITGLSFVFKKTSPTVNKIIVRDPWTNEKNLANKGRKSYGGLFANNIDAFWSIRVYEH